MIVRQAQRANRTISRGSAGLFAMSQYWWIGICGRKLLGRVDLRVDRGHFGNHMTIKDAPRADNSVRRFRISSGPGLCIKLGMCGCLSQSTLSSQRDRSLTVTFCRKSRPIINGRLFLSISPITGLGLCELRELCERLILPSVWAVLLHKAGDVFTLRPCAPAGKQQVVLDFFEIGWSVILRSDRSVSSQSKQNYLAQSNCVSNQALIAVF